MDDLKKELELAEKGDVDAMVKVANYILWDDESLPVDPELLVRVHVYLTSAIKKGNDEAMLSLGSMYYKGRGVPQNFSESIKWYTKAANLGNMVAMSNLGYCYYYGRDIPVDMEKAYQMFSKSALMGDPVSMYKCGDMFMWGKYVDADQVTGFRCYQQAYRAVAADKPTEIYPDVCLRLGSCYHYGRGIPKDLRQAEGFLSEAKMYFQKKLDSGDTLSAPGGLKRATEEWLEVEKKLEEGKR